MLQLVASQFSIDCAADGEPRRQITGLAVPWDTPTTDSTGTAVKFAKDSLPVDGRQPKLLEGHDPTQIRGVVTERVSTDDGMMFTAKIADTSAGRDAMQLLLMGAVDAVSVGVIPTKFHYDDDGTMIVEAASWNELSLVPFPAFDAARIATVAASAPEASKPTIESKEDSAMSTLEVVAASAPAVIPTEPIYAQPKREFKLPSIGEYMAAFVAGGHDFAVMNDNIRKFAAPDVTTGDLDGILPLPIVAPIYSGIQGLRPVCDAVGVRAMPASGKIFIVPKITTHTSIGGPATQNTTITAGQYIVTDIQVTKDIYGGYVDVSEASLDWTSPEVLQGLIEDMAKKYALATDNAAADALLAGTSQTTGNVAPTDPADWIAKVHACANTSCTTGTTCPTTSSSAVTCSRNWANSSTVRIVRCSRRSGRSTHSVPSLRQVAKRPCSVCGWSWTPTSPTRPPSSAPPRPERSASTNSRRAP